MPALNFEPTRVEEDLRGLIAGDVRCDSAMAALYASDASIYEAMPLGVVRPRTVDDVVATVRYAAEHRIPLHPRGGGSSLAGGPLGPGLVVDFSRYLRRIVADEGDAITVEAGVVLERLNRHAARRGREFGPDPPNRAVSTVGGAVARDAVGSRWLACGSVHDHVRAVQAVLADGSVVRLPCGPQAAPTDDGGVAERLATGVAEIARRFAEPLQRRRAASLLDRSGYALAAAAAGPQVDLGRLLVGSHGGLALITEATVATVPRPAHAGVTMLLFNSLQAAAEASVELIRYPLRACDLLDRRHVSLARDLDLRYAVMIPAGVEAVLLVEAEAASADRLAANLREIEHLAVDRWGLAAGAVAATHPDDCALIWQLADQAAQRLHRVQGSTTAVPLPREIALPRGAIPEFLNRTLAILKKHQVTASIYVQAGCGLFHLRPFLNLAADGDRQKLRALAGETYASARELGGVVGDGAGRLADDDDAAAAGDEDLAAAAGELKRLFDPLGVFQPGGHPPESPEVAAGGLRSASAAEPERTFALQLDWTPADMGQAADACNGCAACRTQEDASRMCPIFRHAPQEESSPRAKANLVRALLSGRLPADFRRSEACKQLADLCVHCHMCRVECPSNVDVPRLMVELKADFVATNGLDLHDRCLAYVDRLCKLAARVPRLANWAMGNRGARWILEKTLGVAQGRKLPLLSRQPFLHSGFQKQRSRLQADAGDKVLFFVDTFANHFDTQLARAAVEVLEHCGVTVYIPGAQLESAMPMIAQGVVEPARRIAERNVSLLAEAVRQGCAVVTVEPSAALALQREYLHLLPEDNDARIVADAACDWSHYLWSRHQRGLLPLNFQPVDLSVAYHVPCHVKALEIGAPALHLLNLVPGLRIRLLEKGCSGIAGLFGFKRSHYRTSLRMGLPLMTEMRTGRFAAGVTDCSTCRIQMEQGAAKPTLHPAKILALAYGLMPEIADHLKRTNASLVVR